MDITPDMIVGVGTDIINAECLIATAGAIDLGVCFTKSVGSLKSALAHGVTTMFGGGTGSLDSAANLGTPGPNHVKCLIQSTDEIAVNFGFFAKANSSSVKTAESTSFEFPKEVEDQLIAGAMG